MTLVEISEREVIEAARAVARNPHSGKAVCALIDAVILLEERERVAENIDRNDAEKSSNCRICDKPIGVNLDAGECTGWHPDVKCVCGFEMMGGDARQYKFCPYCASPLRPNAAEMSPKGYTGKPHGLSTRDDLPAVDWPGSSPRKLSRREQEIEKRRRSDPMGADRDDIDYGDDSLPTAR